MAQPKRELIRSIAIGPVSTSTLVFRLRGQLYTTVILKASFLFENGGVMPLSATRPSLRHKEEHHEHNAMLSIRAPSDIVPFLEQADILFSGSAYAPPGTKTSALPVRLSLGRTDGEHIWAVLDKQLLVRGRRNPNGTGETLPFERMPITYERAFGGIGHTLNPMGTPNPNIVYMTPEAQESPASFGPISSHWPSRKKLLRGQTRQLFEHAIIELPPDFDAAYFQSAPEDQRIPSLSGDEILLLENLHPEYADLEMRLPGARAFYRVVTAAGMSKPVALRPDTLFIDGEAQICTLTYRGYFPLFSEQAIPSLTVMAGIELGDHFIHWDMDLLNSNSVQLQQASSEDKDLAEQTLTMAEEALTLDESTNPLTLPEFMYSRPQNAAPPEDPRYGTLLLDERPQASAEAPFPLARPSQPPSQPGSAPIPGAPWAGGASKSVPSAANLESTLSLMHQIPVPAKPSPQPKAETPPQTFAEEAAPKAKPEIPAPAAPSPKASWSWAPPPPAESQERKAPEPQKSAPLPRKSLKDKLYGGSGDRNTKK